MEIKAKTGKNVSADFEHPPKLGYIRETSTRCNFYLPTQLHYELKVEAKKQQRSMSILCENALRLYLKDCKEGKIR